MKNSRMLGFVLGLMLCATAMTVAMPGVSTDSTDDGAVDTLTTGVDDGIETNAAIPPVAAAGGPYTVNEGATLQFNGSASYDPDGIIVSPVTLVDVSGNGQYVVIGWGANVTLFSISSQVPLWTRDMGSNVMAAALSESGQYLAVGYTNHVAFFNTASSTPVWSYTTTYPIASTPRESLDISRDGSRVAVGTGNTFTTTGDIYMFTSTGSLRWRYSFPADVRSVRFSGDGNYVVAGSWMHQLRLYGTYTGTLLWSTSVGDPNYATALSYDASFVASGQGWANTVLLYNRTGTLLRTYNVAGSVSQMAMQDDGTYMVEAQYLPYGSVNGFRLLRTDSTTIVWTKPLSLGATSVDAATDFDFIVGGCYDDRVYLFNKASPTPLFTHGTGGNVSEVSMDYAGQYFAAASEKGLFVYSTAGAPALLWTWSYVKTIPGYELTYAWDFGDGTTGTGATPTHVYMDDGFYTATLTVTDKEGLRDTDTAIVTVNDLAPTARFTPSTFRQNEGSPITFTDNSVSYPDTIVAWSWDFGGAGTSALQNPTFTFMDNGYWAVTLTVTDDDGSTDDVTLSVLIYDLAPTASFTWAPEPQGEGSLVQFTDASTSYPDSIVSWLWDFGDGGTSALQNPSHAYGREGAYTVTLTVTDDDGSASTAAATVGILNVAPAVSIGSFDTALPDAFPTLILPYEAVTFHGSFTDAGWLDTHTIAWDFGDGSAAAGTLDPAHSYAAPGNYTVTLRVTDDGGAYGEASVTVTVSSTLSAIDLIKQYIDALPDDAFKNNPDQRTNALFNKLDEVQALIDAGLYQDAIDKLLNDIRPKMDGSLGGNPNNDWITDPVAQADLCAMIDALVATLEAMIGAP